MQPETIHKILSKKFDNVILKPGRVWLVAGGDVYIIKTINNKLIIRRNWWNPILWLTVAALEYSLIALTNSIFKLHLSPAKQTYILLIILGVSVILAAKNNKQQKQFINSLKNYLQHQLETSPGQNLQNSN